MPTADKIRPTRGENELTTQSYACEECGCSYDDPEEVRRCIRV